MQSSFRQGGSGRLKSEVMTSHSVTNHPPEADSPWTWDDSSVFKTAQVNHLVFHPPTNIILQTISPSKPASLSLLSPPENTVIAEAIKLFIPLTFE